MFTILEFEEKYNTASSLVENIRKLVAAAQNGKLIARYSKLIADKADDFIYWVKNYQHFQSVNDIITDYLRGSVKYIILHALLAIMCDLPHDARHIPVYLLADAYEVDRVIIDPTIINSYYHNFYHILLTNFYDYFEPQDTRGPSIYYQFKYYYMLYILEYSIIPKLSRHAGMNYVEELNMLSYFSFLENDGYHYGKLASNSKLVDTNKLFKSQLFISESNGTVYIDYEQLTPIIQSDAAEAKYRQDIFLRHNFYNYTSYYIYNLKIYQHKDADYDFQLSNNLTRSYARHNYFIQQTWTMRKAIPKRPYQITGSTAMLRSPLTRKVLNRAHAGQVNISYTNLLILIHIAQYGLHYHIKLVMQLYNTIYYDVQNRIIANAILVKCGIDNYLLHTLNVDLAFAAIVTGILPHWHMQNLIYAQKIDYDPSIGTNLSVIPYGFFTQKAYEMGYKIINDTTTLAIALANIKTITYNVELSFASNNVYLKYDKLYDIMIKAYSTWLPRLNDKNLMHVSLLHYMDSKALHKYKIQLWTYFNYNQRGYVNYDGWSYYGYDSSYLYMLSYIDFTLDNQALADKYDIANIIFT